VTHSARERANCDQLPFAFRDGIPIVLLGDGIYLAALHMTFHDYC
jgi:hypothetical protein